MSGSTDQSFLVGGRYRNRRGEYEVLDVAGGKMRVRYDDGEEAVLDIEVQRRILANLELEASQVAPYKDASSEAANERYFFSIGFLARRTTLLEAVVHPKASAGFAQTYQSIKGRKPRRGQQGFYVHSPSADKWGNELRVTFRASNGEVGQLDFGPDVTVVADLSAPGASWRINNNGFWWRLLRLGFEMGSQQDVSKIEQSIPPMYRRAFQSGYNYASSGLPS